MKTLINTGIRAVVLCLLLTACNGIQEGGGENSGGNSHTTVAVTGITVSPSTIEVQVAKTTTLTATVSPSNASNKRVTWSSDASSIATVSSSGVVTGVAEGNATITATSNSNGSITGSCAVTVTKATDPDPDPDPDPTPAPVPKLVFIHHSTGGNLLADVKSNGIYGGLGAALTTAGFFVSDICYGWGRAPFSGIGDRTDIGNWHTWFADVTPQGNTTLRDTIMNAVYKEFNKTNQYGSYTRKTTDPYPEAENCIVVIKSCYPNSDIYLSDPVKNAKTIFGQTVNEDYTLENAQEVYNAILPYMQSHPDKMFVVITAPPRASDNTTIERAAEARKLNDWLCEDWLGGYTGSNVFVWDFFNVLTAEGNHHKVNNNVVVRTTIEGSGNTSVYCSDDEHPNTTGSCKAAGEFTECLTLWYTAWAASRTQN